VNIFVYLFYILLNVLKVLTPEFCAVLETLAKQAQDYIDLKTKETRALLWSYMAHLHAISM